MAKEKDVASLLQSIVDEQTPETSVMIKKQMETPVIPQNNDLSIETYDKNFIDYKNIEGSSTRDARKLLYSTIKSVCGEDLLENPYFKNRISIDVRTLSGILNQLKINELVHKRLIEDIVSGATSPRYYEVSSTYANTIAALNKQVLATIESIKNIYKQMKDEMLPSLTDYPDKDSLDIDSETVIFSSKEHLEEIKKQRAKKYSDNIIDIPHEEK